MLIADHRSISTQPCRYTPVTTGRRGRNGRRNAIAFDGRSEKPQTGEQYDDWNGSITMMTSIDQGLDKDLIRKHAGIIFKTNKFEGGHQ